jgi:hypothetical protein
MVDRYTKVILTIIALALVALVLRPVLEPRVASAVSECGTFSNPCYVTTRSGDSVNVKIVTR